MKNRIFSIVLALVLPLALAVPALAAEEPEPTPEPEYRLVSVVVTDTYGLQSYYAFTYGQGGYLPTEVTCANNDSFPVTAVYDEDWRVTSLQAGYGSDEYVYDEAGNRVRLESTYDYGATVIEYSYDEAGNCVRRESTYDYGDGPSTTVIECSYDEEGNCVREESAYSGGSTWVSEYTYDEAGNLVREEATRTDGGSAYSVEYTYDGEDRMLSRVVVDGEETREDTYAYSEDGRSVKITEYNGNITVEYAAPLMDVRWINATYELVDGGEFSEHSCNLTLKDSEGNSICAIHGSFDNEPTPTYDDNGYLVRVDGTAGDYIELTYEPVA